MSGRKSIKRKADAKEDIPKTMDELNRKIASFTELQTLNNFIDDMRFHKLGFSLPQKTEDSIKAFLDNPDITCMKSSEFQGELYQFLIYQSITHHEPSYTFNNPFLSSDKPLTKPEDITIDWVGTAIVLAYFFMDLENSAHWNILSYMVRSLYNTFSRRAPKMDQKIKDFIYNHALGKNVLEIDQFITLSKICSKKHKI